ncbi:hypothetical protein [Rhizobium sp. L1K21]|uniref:hypothetical protein n=1 Tax=Rhizobium sp. L1K21 TaxID=2954933 RepID=UPI002092BB4F|nr:hypothetical protein [Rhizobium sp. L1K21]MCO6186959.1 hypothetical protein [Rhizobium sp. L1K21]
MPVSENAQPAEALSDRQKNLASSFQATWKAKARIATRIAHFSADAETFETRVRELANELGGDYLFGLPASGLVKDCQRIAAMRLPVEGKDVDETIFILLDNAGETVRLSNKKDQLQDVEKFAAAFIDVLGRIGPLPDTASGEAQSTN